MGTASGVAQGMNGKECGRWVWEGVWGVYWTKRAVTTHGLISQAKPGTKKTGQAGLTCKFGSRFWGGLGWGCTRQGGAEHGLGGAVIGRVGL